MMAYVCVHVYVYIYSEIKEWKKKHEQVKGTSLSDMALIYYHVCTYVYIHYLYTWQKAA